MSYYNITEWEQKEKKLCDAGFSTKQAIVILSIVEGIGDLFEIDAEHLEKEIERVEGVTNTIQDRLDSI